MKKTQNKSSREAWLFRDPLDFDKLDLDYSWGFENANTKYLTHNIHRYPAKFIPQLARKIIQENSQKGQIVLDPFCGSGTTLLEARLLGRNAIGIDLNPVGYYISKVKSNPIDPEVLEGAWTDFSEVLFTRSKFLKTEPFPLSDRVIGILAKWIPEKQLRDLRRLFSLILETEDNQIRDFLIVGFSHILKNCSWWLMKSVKPTRDYSKKVPDVIPTFVKHIRFMTRKNKELWEILKDSNTNVIVFKHDARKLTRVVDGAVDLIMFSPPYVTSYEYVDLHKLGIIWLERTSELKQVKRSFIGTQMTTARLQKQETFIHEIIGKVSIQDERTKNSVLTYFENMAQSFSEMDKVLKPGGKLVIVIGNTELRKVKIRNAEIFSAILHTQGYKLERIVKRPILSKHLPSTRDPQSGRFTSVKKEHIKAYPNEFILFFRKNKKN